MCLRSANYAGIENDLSGDTVEANSMKAYISDLMQESAQTLTQLSGANGFKAENVGSRGIMDSRPFQIFEGSNEMLYTQISEIVLKMMGRQKTVNLLDFLGTYSLTCDALDIFKSMIDFTIDANLPQRKIVDLGKIISRIIITNQLLALEEKGFRSDLIKDSIEIIKHEVSMLTSSYKFQTNVNPIENYHDQSSWLSFC